jgi:hypothetical protein
MWRDISALLDKQAPATTEAAQANGASTRAAESIRVATERDWSLYETYLHDFSDGRDVS